MSTRATGAAGKARPETDPAPPVELSEDDKSKDDFFRQVAELAEAMIARHGKDFAIGTLVLAARFIADGKPLAGRADDGNKDNVTRQG
jgi:hypothetical protein